MDRYSAPSTTITPIHLLCFGLMLFVGYMRFQKPEHTWPDSKPVPRLRKIVASADKIYVHYLHPSKLEKTGEKFSIVRIEPVVDREIDLPDIQADPVLFRETKADACSQAFVDATFDYQLLVHYKGMNHESDDPALFVFNSHTGHLYSLNRLTECGLMTPAFQKNIAALQEKSRKTAALERAANLERARKEAIADLNQQIQKNRARYPSRSSESEGEAIYMGEGKIKILRGPVLLSRPVNSGTN